MSDQMTVSTRFLAEIGKVGLQERRMTDIRFFAKDLDRLLTMLHSGEVVPWSDRFELSELKELPCVTSARIMERERCLKIVAGIIETVRREIGGENYSPDLYVNRAAALIRSGE